MRSNGTGRSNALPITQLLVGAALIVLGLLDALRARPDDWTDWVLAAAGVVQVVAGALTIRRNQRLDRLEDRT